MATVVPNPASIRAFASEAAFEKWLAKNHDRKTEVWITIFKKGSGRKTISPSEAIDVAICWGWIDGIRKSYDDEAFLQRYTPRKAKSRWSQINVERARRLTEAGRMTPHGQKHVDAAMADGRWEAAYPSPRVIELPADFLAAVARSPKARKVLGGLGRSQIYPMALRLHHVRAGERRALLIASLIESLKSGDVVGRPARKPAPKARRATPLPRSSRPRS